MKFYLDEDLSPTIAEIMRRLGTDAITAHDVGMTGTADEEQLDLAAAQGRCHVTRNRNDFILISRMCLDSSQPHCGVIIVPHTFKGNEFRRIAEALVAFASLNPNGLPPYTVAFLNDNLR
jgi:predicted nuclease of predicted toxin-antitoxin system